MRKLILLTLLIAAVSFAQADIDWWVFDNGGGMRSPSAGDTLWASIGQGIIGCGYNVGSSLCAGYLCIFEGTCTKIDEQPPADDEKQAARPFTFGIKSVNPNPFNPSCDIEFELEQEGRVKFEFYDILGNLVAAPLRNQIMGEGRYRLTWNGGELPSGTYFARLSSSGKSEVKSLIYLK